MPETDRWDAGALAPGDLVGGRYRVTGRLGEGGMGVVYEAVHEGLGKPVALKVIADGLAADEAAVERFLREARAAASLGHPGVVQVFDVGSDARDMGRITYLAMEKLEGEELAARLAREGPFAVDDAVWLVAEAAEALSVAHGRGIVHRDLKPQNLFLARVGPREIVKVLDFGIAKLLEGGDGADGPLTRTGEVFGTPAYMAPEQLAGARDVDARADVWALAVVLYELLAGRPPFVADTFSALVLAISRDEPAPLSTFRGDVPRALDAAIRSALGKDPADRPPTTLTFAEQLKAAMSPAPPPDAPPRATTRYVPLTALLVVAALGVWAVARGGGDGATAPPSTAAAETTPGEATPAARFGPGGPGATAAATRVRFVSTPDAVEVQAGDAACVTPCALPLPPEPVFVVGRRPGYHSRTEMLEPPFPAEVSITLPARAR